MKSSPSKKGNSKSPMSDTLEFPSGLEDCDFRVSEYPSLISNSTLQTIRWLLLIPNVVLQLYSFKMSVLGMIFYYTRWGLTFVQISLGLCLYAGRERAEISH